MASSHVGWWKVARICSAWRLSEKELDEVEADDVGSQYRIVWCECIREQVAAAIEQIMWKTDTDGSFMVVSVVSFTT